MTYRIEALLWRSDSPHDKVWGWATVQDEETYVFWGRRGYTMAFQRLDGMWARNNAQTKERQKRKTYEFIPERRYEEIWPGFIERFELELMTAKLANRFRHTAEQ